MVAKLPISIRMFNSFLTIHLQMTSTSRTNSFIFFEMFYIKHDITFIAERPQSLTAIFRWTVIFCCIKNLYSSLILNPFWNRHFYSPFTKFYNLKLKFYFLAISYCFFFYFTKKFFCLLQEEVVFTICKALKKNGMLYKNVVNKKCIFCTDFFLFCKAKNAKKKDAKIYLVLPLHFVGAEHFPLENVQLCKNAVFFALQKTKMRTFCWCVAKMHL